MTLHETQNLAHGQPAQAAKSVPAETPPGGEGTPEIKDEAQYGGLVVKQMVRDALAADGRVQKDRADMAEGNVTKLTGELDTLTTNFGTLTNQMAEITRNQNEAEIAKYSEDKPAQDSVRVRQANAAEKTRLQGVDTAYQTRETKFAEKEVTFAKKETGLNIKLAAMAAGVDEVRLATLVPDGDPGRLTEAATLLKGTVAPEIDPINKPPKLPGLTNTPATLASTSGDHRSVSEKMIAKAKGLA